MKKILLSLFFIAPGLMATAQQISVNTAIDSAYYNCTMPLPAQFVIGGNASGFSSGDSVTLTLETGDGAVYVQTQPASTYFNTIFNHTYTVHGNYSVKYKAEIPGAIDSVVIANNIMAGVCDTLYGTVYRDNNGNCTWDGGEPAVPGFNIGLIAPGESYPTYSANTNNFGSFAIEAPTSTNLLTLSYLSGANCPVLGSQVSVPGIVDIPITGSIYFNYVGTDSSSICVNDSTFFYGQYIHSGLGATDTIHLTMFFGDGTSQSFTRLGSQSGHFSTAHYFASPGTYQAMFILNAIGISDTIILPTQNTIVTCGNVNGTIYHDSDQDCTQDPGESALSNSYVVAYDSGGNTAGSATTNQNGQYSMNLPTGSSYTIQAFPGATGGYIVTCPTSGQYSVNTFPSTNDFAMSCPTAFDLKAQGSATSIVPGMPVSFNFYGINNSCVHSPGTLEVVFDQTHLTIDSFSIAPASITGNLITWNFNSGNISPKIYAHADTIVQLGDTLCFPISVTPITGDFNSTNNTYNLCKVVSSSYDPNMKEGWHGIGSEGYIKQETTLDYTIHFQNTGTAPAMNIYIRDTLPPELDPSTLEIIGASHPFNWYSWQGNQLKFEFNNINLPDSNSNEPASKGFVMYRIKTVPNLPHGSKIENGAAIYFDYNEPVITNKTLHTIDIFLSVDENGPESKLAELYPNPSSGYVYVDFKGKEGIVTLYSISGSEVRSMSLRNGVNTLELDKLSPGIYFFTIRSGEEVMSGKMIKQ